LAVYTNFVAPGSGDKRAPVSSGISVVMTTGSGTSKYSTLMVDEKLSSEESFVYIPDSPLVCASGEAFTVYVAPTGGVVGLYNAYAYTTIHIGY
jgi:hypothetical protein